MTKLFLLTLGLMASAVASNPEAGDLGPEIEKNQLSKLSQVKPGVLSLPNKWVTLQRDKLNKGEGIKEIIHGSSFQSLYIIFFQPSHVSPIKGKLLPLMNSLSRDTFRNLRSVHFYDCDLGNFDLSVIQAPIKDVQITKSSLGSLSFKVPNLESLQINTVKVQQAPLKGRVVMGQLVKSKGKIDLGKCPQLERLTVENVEIKDPHGRLMLGGNVEGVKNLKVLTIGESDSLGWGNFRSKCFPWLTALILSKQGECLRACLESG